MQWAREPAAFHRGQGVAKSGSLRSTREAPSCVALAVTCAIHALLMCGLVRIPASPTPRPDRVDDVLQVIWVERPEAVSADSMRIPAETHAAERPVTRPQRERPAAAVVAPVSPSSVDAAVEVTSTPAVQTLVVTDDAWRPLPGPRRSGADIDPSAFRRDPLARRDTSFDPKPAALEEAIQDRSFGGWMQGATRKRMCGDLRAALSRSPESTYSIMESARKRGCRL
jgi:hypothetical protein